ncbi:hypothetical protein HAX54_006295, partial [Datura stramonium]|nr:hypothetical protein [Datura stramonium]
SFESIKFKFEIQIWLKLHYYHSTGQSEALQVLHLVRTRVMQSLVTKNKQHLPKPIQHVAPV